MKINKYPRSCYTDNKDKCMCGQEEIELHPCPYAQDINDDHKTLCDCCDYCQSQCADDI